MKTSTEIGSIYRQVGEERAIELVAKAGFDAWDFSMSAYFTYDWNKGIVLDKDCPFRSSEYLPFVRRLKQVGLDNGIHCNQSHAPFPSHVKEIEDYFKRSIECTAEVGGNICVIHPDNRRTAAENGEMYNALLPFAKEYGVKIATENMWAWDVEANKASFAVCATVESFKEHLDAVDDDYLVACVDIGHAEMMGDMVSAESLIRGLGDKVHALHIHDNDRWHDSHRIPFSMDIDFTKVAKALKDINYQGYLTLECDGYIKSAEDIEEKVKSLCLAVKRLDALIEEI